MKKGPLATGQGRARTEFLWSIVAHEQATANADTDHGTGSGRAIIGRVLPGLRKQKRIGPDYQPAARDIGTGREHC